jgi:hypothetical protein
VIFAFANSETLRCKTQIFGLGLAKSYIVREMRNLRFQPATGAGKSRRASRIAFDYGANTITFGADLEEGGSGCINWPNPAKVPDCWYVVRARERNQVLAA